MSRRSVRVTIPKGSPEKLLKLVADIIKEHNALGDESPLKDDIDMPRLGELFGIADGKRDEAEYYDALKQGANQDSRIAMGVAKGQTAATPDTLYYLILLIRNLLLVVFSGRVEQLERFGFDVVVSISSSSSNGTEEGTDDGGGIAA